MKYVVFFLLVCVAFAAAAPQLLTTLGGYGGYGAYGVYGPGLIGGVPNTLVAGPTVVNTPGLGYTTYGGRIIAPGVVV